jgi:hypothetical protein
MNLCTSAKNTSNRTTSSAELYTVFCADSEDFHHSLHEAVQILQLSYVYSFKYVLLLVGDA